MSMEAVLLLSVSFLCGLTGRRWAGGVNMGKSVQCVKGFRWVWPVWTNDLCNLCPSGYSIKWKQELLPTPCTSPKKTPGGKYQPWAAVQAICFTPRSLSQFELILVKGTRSASRLIFFHMDSQLFQHLIEKYYVFSLKMLTVLLSKIHSLTVFMWMLCLSISFCQTFCTSLLQIPCNEVEKQVHLCNEIHFHGYKHLLRVGRPLDGFRVPLLRLVGLDWFLLWLLKFQDLVFQTRKPEPICSHISSPFSQKFSASLWGTCPAHS